jgi:hypothetical protein
MRRIRRQLTFANVVSVTALFVALGGTAIASVIITDNSQVASNTISGHKPPSGKHSNLIAQSVNGSDVADNTLGGLDINEASLTGNARRLDYTVSPSPGNTPTTIAKVGPYAIKGQCTPTTVVRLIVNGPAGTADIMWSQVRNDSTDEGDHSNGMLIPANTDTTILAVFTGASSSYVRAGGRAILRSGSALVQVDFEATANAQGSGSCFIYGTATRAT